MYIKASRKWQFALEIAMVVLGTFVMGFAFSVFLEPNEISTGGFSALSMVISIWLAKIGLPNIPTSAIYLVLNIGLYFLALKTLGKKFAIKALIGIVSFSLSMELFSMLNINLPFETLVSAIYGGVIMGVGVGLVVRFGGSTGGSDMIACIVKKKNPTATIGTLMICVDMFIIFLTVITFSNGVGLLPYTIIALVLSMFITDFVNEGYKQIRAFNIVTTKPEALAEAIMDKLARGCTMSEVKGMHSKSDKCILICLASKYQSGQLKGIIKSIDPDAFVYMTKVSEVIGAWSTVEEIQKETAGKQDTNPARRGTLKSLKRKKKEQESIAETKQEVTTPQDTSNVQTESVEAQDTNEVEEVISQKEATAKPKKSKVKK